jgi:Zn ribbon nucleic-acid-binding protein
MSNYTFLGNPVGFQPAICVDFDGTLCEHEFPGIGAPKAGAKEALAMFRRLGYHVMIWSCRTCGYFTEEFGGGEAMQRDRVKEMVDWLNAHGFEYDSIDDGTKGITPVIGEAQAFVVDIVVRKRLIAGAVLIAAANRGRWDMEQLLRGVACGHFSLASGRIVKAARAFVESGADLDELPALVEAVKAVNWEKS